MESGALVNDNIVEEFNKMRMKRAHRYMIMKHNHETSNIEIEHIGERNATFNDFKEKMPKDACR